MITIDNIKNTEIRESDIHGLGLFCIKKIEKNSILCFLDGQVINWDVYEKINFQAKMEIGEDIDSHFFMEWNALDQETLLVRPLRTKYSYINHSKKNNIKIQRNPLRIVSTKIIEPDNELLIDYTQEPLRRKYLDDPTKRFLSDIKY